VIAIWRQRTWATEKVYVVAADYVVWRKGLGTTYTQNDCAPVTIPVSHQIQVYPSAARQMMVISATTKNGVSRYRDARTRRTMPASAPFENNL
jgi:hypothetical protein